jgi:serine/threonine-protein kinase
MTADVERVRSALADRYAIQEELGSGGMATVYLAQDLKHDRKVAVKVLRPELAAVLGAERFVQEIKTTASLQHPHILPLHDSGEADGFLYYVMPYIEGETLRDKLNRETQLGLRYRARGERGCGRKNDGDRSLAGYAALHEPGAGDGGEGNHGALGRVLAGERVI